MNVADSQRLGSALEKLGYASTDRPDDADIIVLNTCVVRQGAEDRAVGRLTSLKPLKERRPDVVIGLMGCLVGVQGNGHLREHFPTVDLFLPPSNPRPLIEYLLQREGRSLAEAERVARHALQDGELTLPSHERNRLVSAHVPVIYGCNHVCSFCIIPYRRGTERSRRVGEIVAEVRSLVRQGVREVTLLGQIVDRYGFDIPDGPRLPDLLRAVHRVEGLERIRFLTSHPNYITDELLDTVADLPKVCEHIEVPVQAGNDEVLRRMRRGYTVEEYRQLVRHIRERLPACSLATDVIVGFPGETEAQFQDTYNLLRELRFDVAHIAAFSPRPHTAAARWPDDVPLAEKERRRRALDELQAEIVGEINSRLLGQTVEILVEEKHKGRWKGRTRTNKLVFFEDDTREWGGRLANVEITWAGPWSMQGRISGNGATK
jgi:tRNA-2-methylthio-N6-dimethylallyladenosine synthase